MWLILFSLLFLFSCKHEHKQSFSHHALGYHYRLLAFDTHKFQYKPNHVARVSVTFKTQSDSVFWDSFNNFNDCFFIRIDSLQRSNFLQHYVSCCTEKDSACLLIPTDKFFLQQFELNQIPFFSKNDSAVKINLRVKEILTPAEFSAFNENLRKKEQNQIDEYLKSHAAQKDETGFYWLHKSDEISEKPIKNGSLVKIAYSGYYLNGRFLEKAENFELIYGMPHQMLKGLNYVIPKLKKGAVAKIILPSRLAYGESGSSNGTVPPFTPLLYEIKIIDIKE